MDQIFWESNWTEPSDEVFFPRLKDALKSESWVLDGNYQRTQAIKWEKIDQVIWLDYSFARTLKQSVLRSFTRALRKSELWPGTGNRESFYRSFFSKQSVLLWMMQTHAKNRERYQATLNDPAYGHIKFLHIKSPQEAQDFLDSCGTR